MFVFNDDDELQIPALTQKLIAFNLRFDFSKHFLIYRILSEKETLQLTEKGLSAAKDAIVPLDILPDLVLGSLETVMALLKAATGPMSSRTCSTISCNTESSPDSKCAVQIESKLYLNEEKSEKSPHTRFEYGNSQRNESFQFIWDWNDSTLN